MDGNDPGNDQEIVILRVISNPKTILNWFVFKVNGHSTFCLY